mmetsp:Transcript_38926/g.67368  ORF Transcript_38926/g.67368 Transcript_38926/m.67368 type:complete len:786 (-) Transcript_38926:303-2660(-)
MSVAGIDFGNLNLLIGQTSKGGVDVILNESSNRQTAVAVSVQGKQRFIGDSGAAMARSNITNTISMMKMLVGRKFDDADVQAEIANLPFKTVKLPSGGVGISIMYNDEPLTVSAEHAMAMMLVKAKDTSSKANAGVNIGDAVLAVPHWFTESQRRGVVQAAEIAQLNCLKVANESVLVALSYGIFKSAKKLFSETEPQHVMFIDIGFTGMSVTIVDFIQENMKVLSTVCERTVNGRNLDNIIIEFLAETFQKKTGKDVRKNIKAVLKLQAAAEKAKKTLSPAGVNEVNISVECLADDIDLNALLTRKEFEDRTTDLVSRLRAPIEKCLQEAGLTASQLTETEIVGGTSRVNIIKRTLGEILQLDASALNYGLKTTMNADEASSRGGALQCAMLSSRVKVKPFNIIDRLPYGIAASFEGEEGKISSVSLYSRNDEVPHKPRRLTFKNKTSDFDITLSYDDAAVAILPVGESRFLSRCTIKIPQEIAASAAGNDVRVTWNLDKHGFVYVSSAQLMEEIPYTAEELAAAAGETKEGETKIDPTKKRFKKTDLQVVVATPGLTGAEVKAALELEAQMAFEDKLITETADKRNELESYIYSMRDKLDGSLSTYGSAAEKDKLKALLTTAEDWLYGDGFDSTKAQYTREIEKLRAVGDLLEKRLTEAEGRPQAIEGLKKQLDLCKAFASKYGEDYAHIEEEDRDQLRKEVRNTEDWMYDMISQQGSLPNHAEPLLTAESINVKRNALFKVSNPIMTKPKPKAPEPSTTPSPTPEAKSSEPMDQAKGGPEEK